jgi:hypothetical protein
MEASEVPVGRFLLAMVTGTVICMMDQALAASCWAVPLAIS